MKVKVPVAVLVLLALVVGYLLGTEAGRERRDQMARRVRRETDAPADDVSSDAGASEVEG